MGRGGGEVVEGGRSVHVDEAKGFYTKAPRAARLTLLVRTVNFWLTQQTRN